MKFKSYAQHGEDYLIWEFFDRKTSGLIIEVGAFDGKYLSNSYALERQGWKAVCVEPLPYYYELLKKNRPNAVNVNAALVSDDSIETIIIHEDVFGVFSSTKEVNVRLVNTLCSDRGISFSDTKPIQVRGVTLNNLVEKYKLHSIDCISIDVEGTELDVLKGIDFNVYRPKLLVVEANEDLLLNEIVNYLEDNGYFLVLKNNVNYFFTSDNINTKQLTDTKIDCVSPLFRHPKGLKYTEQSPYISRVNNLWLKIIRRLGLIWF
jgi:FkbM family methyltransferase